MNQNDSPPAQKPPLPVSREGNFESALQVIEIKSATLIETHICCRPSGGSLSDQVQSIYALLGRELREREMSTDDVVLERFFLPGTGTDTDMENIQTARSAYYGQIQPALFAVQQPPLPKGQLLNGQLCELQAIVMRSAAGESLQSRNLVDGMQGATARVIELGSVKQYFITGINGSVAGQVQDADQAQAMFEQAIHCLELIDLSFLDVPRKWIFLADMARDYDSINRARNTIYDIQGIHPPPASTGIGGATSPVVQRCSMGLVALASPAGVVPTQQVRTEAMGEAYDYRSAFSRGMTVDYDDRTVVYISGTASINADNQIVHLDDIDGQLEKMLLNVKQLLEAANCNFQHVSNAVTYLKHPDFFEPCMQMFKRHGLSDQFVNTVCLAEVCRPQWLCEIEVTAVRNRN